MRLFAGILLILATGIAGANETGGVTTAVSAADNVRPLRVGIFDDFAPVAYERNGTLQGIEVDLANRVSTAMKRPLELKVYAFTELLNALVAGEVDVVMSGLSITPEREERVLFSEPYMGIGQMAIVRTEDAGTLAKPAAMDQPGLKMGVHLGSTGEAFVRENYPEAEVFAFKGVEKALEALRWGELDMVVHDSTTSWRLSTSFINDELISLNRYLTEEQIAWAVNKDNPDLVVALNLILANMRESGELNDILLQWLPEFRPL